MFARNYKEYLIARANKLGLAVNMEGSETKDWYVEMEKIIEHAIGSKEKIEKFNLYDEIRKDMLTITKGLLLTKNIKILDVIEDYYMDEKDIIVSTVYVDLEDDEFTKTKEELYRLLENYSKTKTGDLHTLVFLKSREEYEILMKDYENEKNSCIVVNETQDILKGLERAISDKTLELHHWYRSYTIFDVVSTENRDVYRITYLDHERFDIIDIEIKTLTHESYVDTLYTMKRSIFNMQECSNDKYLTFKERIMKSVRNKVSGIVEYGEWWQVSSWFDRNYDGYIRIIPSTRKSAFNPCTGVELRGNIRRVLTMSNDELSELIERISEEALRYANAMVSNIRRGNPYENKYEEEESLYGYQLIEKEFEF